MTCHKTNVQVRNDGRMQALLSQVSTSEVLPTVSVVRAFFEARDYMGREGRAFILAGDIVD